MSDSFSLLRWMNDFDNVSFEIVRKKIDFFGVNIFSCEKTGSKEKENLTIEYYDRL